MDDAVFLLLLMVMVMVVLLLLWMVLDGDTLLNGVGVVDRSDDLMVLFRVSSFVGLVHVESPCLLVLSPSSSSVPFSKAELVL